MHSAAMQVYLDDHLAGAESAIELVEDGLKRQPGGALERLLEELLVEIREDRDVLVSLRERLGGQPSVVKKAAAWMAEKVGRLKLAGAAGVEPDFGWFEALEALALGIRGKMALWAALGAVRTEAQAFADVDFDGLYRRAEDQFDRVEAQRLDAARRAFTDADAGGREPSA